MQFVKAERKRSKLRLAIAGVSGSGKTTAALQIAKSLGGKIAVIDTENGSSSLYSDRFDFDVLELSAPYTPERFVQAIELAEQSGYNSVIIDSMSHEWIGSGGCLEINDTLAKTKYKGNSFAAWNEAGLRHYRFLEKLVTAKLHVLATVRMKAEHVQEGKKVSKVGMKYEMRDGFEYEFTSVFDLSHEGHYALVSKDRTRLFDASTPFLITPEVGKSLGEWLNSGKNLYMSDENTAHLNGLLRQLPADEQVKVKNKYPNFAEELDSRFSYIEHGLTTMLDKHKAAAEKEHANINQPMEYNAIKHNHVKKMLEAITLISELKQARPISQEIEKMIGDAAVQIEQEEATILRDAIFFKTSELIKNDLISQINQCQTLDDADKVRTAIDAQGKSLTEQDYMALNQALAATTEEIGAAG